MFSPHRYGRGSHSRDLVRVTKLSVRILVAAQQASCSVTHIAKDLMTTTIDITGEHARPLELLPEELRAVAASETRRAQHLKQRLSVTKVEFADACEPPDRFA